jgi:hypothetical protein
MSNPILALAAAAFVLLSPAAIGQSGAQPSTGPSPAAAPSVSQQTAPNAVTQAAANAGVRACLNRIDQFTRFLSSAGQTGSMLFVPPSNPDQRLFSTSMEILIPGGQVYASASFSPVGQDGCGGLYETVSWWPNNCPEVATKAFPEMRRTNPLARNIEMYVGNIASIRVFLMPAGPGCISIKKEVVF